MQGRTGIPSPVFCSWFIPLTTAIQPFLVCIIVASNSWAPHLWLFIRGLIPTKGPRWTHSWDRKIWRLSCSHLVGLGIRFYTTLDLYVLSWRSVWSFMEAQVPLLTSVDQRALPGPCVLNDDHSLPLFHRRLQSPFPSTEFCSSVWESLSQLRPKSWLRLPGFLTLSRAFVSTIRTHTAQRRNCWMWSPLQHQQWACCSAQSWMQQTFVKWMKEKLLHLLSHLRGQASGQAPSPPPSPFTPCH